MDDLLIGLGLILFIVGIIMLIVSFIKKTKKKKSLLLILIGFVVWIVGGAFVDTNILNNEPYSSTSTDFKDSKDISIIMGLTIEEAQQKTGLIFETMGTELLEPNIEKFKSGNDNIVVYTNTDTNKIYEIHLFHSDYNLFGITNKMKAEEQNEKLIKNGFTEIADSVYRYKDTYDGIETYPSLVYKSNYLQELVLKSDTEKAYKKTLPSTIGAIYIGNGQMLEYSSTSLPYIAYELENTTEINKGNIIEKYNGTYIQISGKVTEVFEDGTIRVLSADEEATDSLGKLWPLQAYSDITLVPEEQNILHLFKIDAEVVFYAKVDMNSYQNILGMQCFECYDGILYSYVDDSVSEVITTPLINSVTSGIQTPLNSKVVEDNKTSVFSDKTSSNEVNSNEEAINAVKAYVEREGYSDPYDMYEAEYYAGYYQVYAGHSYLGDDWIEDSFTVYEDDSNNVQLVQP